MKLDDSRLLCAVIAFCIVKLDLHDHRTTTTGRALTNIIGAAITVTIPA